MIRRLTFSLRALLVLALLPALAVAQPAPDRFSVVRAEPAIAAINTVTGEVLTGYAALAQSLQAPNRLDVVKRIDALCPGYIAQDHAFTDTVATVLKVGAVLRPSNDRETPLVVVGDDRWGRNGKRGNRHDPSHDAIAFTNPSVPFGVSIVDIIGGAGGPNPTPAWIDQTQETLNQRTTGVLVEPSGGLPSCLVAGGTPPPSPAPVPTPTPAPAPAPVDLTPLVEAVNRLEARIAAIESRPAPSLDLFAAYVDDMVGHGPADDPALAANHVTDIKQRLDVIRQTLEQLNAWLRSRPVLRF